jgi:hypothetical protein
MPSVNEGKISIEDGDSKTIERVSVGQVILVAVT